MPVMELLEVGDRVETGSYCVLSRFGGATAFVRDQGEGLAVVVEEDKGAGPMQIVVRGCNAGAIDSLEVRPEQVVLGGVPMEICRRYRSQLQIGEYDPARLNRILHVFGAALRLSAPARSVVCLCDSGSPFEAAVARRIREGVNLLVAGDLDSGAGAIAGLGFGLTPSCDDFLAGFLLGMYATGAPAADRQRIYQAARSPNVFSESMLRCAADGCCVEPAKALIHAIFGGTGAEVARHTARLSTIGASSGADLAAGLHCFLQAACDGRTAEYRRVADTAWKVCA